VEVLAVRVSGKPFSGKGGLVFTLILQGILEIGAGEGNRTLISIPQGGHAKNPVKSTH
jgi:hypothetical protein